MNKIEIVKKAFSFDTPLEERKEYLSGDYQFVDSIGSPPQDIYRLRVIPLVWKRARAEPRSSLRESLRCLRAIPDRRSCLRPLERFSPSDR